MACCVTVKRFGVARVDSEKLLRNWQPFGSLIKIEACAPLCNNTIVLGRATPPRCFIPWVGNNK